MFSSYIKEDIKNKAAPWQPISHLYVHQDSMIGLTFLNHRERSVFCNGLVKCMIMIKKNQKILIYTLDIPQHSYCIKDLSEAV